MIDRYAVYETLDGIEFKKEPLGPWAKFEDVQELEAHSGAFARKVAKLEVEKRELVEMLGEVLFRADMGTYTDIEDRALALIAKHKE